MERQRIKKPQHEVVDLAEAMELVQKGEEALNLITNKTLLYVLGETGSGKTTLLLSLLGNKIINKDGVQVLDRPSQETDIGVIGVDRESQTRYIRAQACRDLMLVDGPGTGDTGGKTVDLANLICSASFLQNCQSVIPVFLIEYNAVCLGRGDEFRSICQGIAEMFIESELPKVLDEGYLHIFFTHVPFDKNLKDVQDLVVKTQSANDATLNTEKVLMILDFINEKITNKSQQIKIINPASDKRGMVAKGLVNYFHKVSPLAEPSSTIGFPLQGALKIASEKAIRDLKVKIDEKLSSREVVVLAQLLDLLQKVSNRVKLFKNEYTNSAKSLSDRLLDCWNTAVKGLVELVNNINHWKDEDIRRVNEFSELLTKLEQEHCLKHFPEVKKQADFDNIIYELVRTLVGKIRENDESKPNFARMHYVMERLLKLKQNLNLSSPPPDLEQEAKAEIERKLRSCLSTLEKHCFQGDNIPEIRRNLALLQTRIEDCHEAANSVVQYTSFNNVDLQKQCGSKIEKIITDTKDSLLEQIKQIKSKDDVTETLKGRCLLLKELSVHPDLAKHSESFGSIWEEVKKEVKNHSQEVATLMNSNGTNSSTMAPLFNKINAIASIDQEFGGQIGASQGESITRLESKVVERIQKVEDEITIAAPNYTMISMQMNEVKKYFWIDQCAPGLSSVGERYEQVRQQLVAKVKQIQNAVIVNWKRKNFNSVATLIEQYDTLSEVSELIPDFNTIRDQSCDSIATEIVQTMKTVEESIKSDGLSFKDVDDQLTQLVNMAIICNRLGREANRKSLEEKLKNYAIEKATEITRAIQTEKYKFTSHSQRLSQLSVASNYPNLSHLDQQLADAKLAVQYQFHTLVNKFNKENADDDPSASKTLEQIEEGICLASYYPDIPQSILTLQLAMIANRKKDVEKVPTWLTQHDYWSISHLLAQHPEDSHTRRSLLEQVKRKLNDLISGINPNPGYTTAYSNDANKKFDDFITSIGYLEKATQELNKELKGAKDIVQKIAGLYKKMDDNLAESIKNAIFQYINNYQFSAADRIKGIIETNIRPKELRFNITNQMLSDYKTQVDRFWNTLKIDIEARSTNLIYEALESDPMFVEKLGVYSNNIIEAVKARLNRAESLPYEKAKEQLDEIKRRIDALYLDPLCRKELECLFKRSADFVNQRLSHLSSDFGEAMRKFNIEKALKTYHSAKQQDAYTAKSFEGEFLDLYKDILNYLAQSICQQQPSLVIKDISDYLRLKQCPGYKPLKDTTQFASLKSLAQKLTAEIQDNKSVYQPELVSKILFLVQLSSFLEDIPKTDLPKVVDVEALSVALAPITKILAETHDKFVKGIKSYSFSSIASALCTAKELDPLIQVLITSNIRNSKLVSLNLEVGKAQSYKDMQNEANSFIKDLNKTTLKAWEDKDMDAVYKIILGLDTLISLKREFPGVSDLQTSIKNVIREEYLRFTNEIKDSLSKGDIGTFNRLWEVMEKTKKIEDVIGETKSSLIHKDIKAQIDRIGEDIKQSKDLPATAKHMIDLQRMQEHFPMATKDVQDKMRSCLNQLSPVAVSNLGALLDSDGSRLAQEITQTYSAFSQVQVQKWMKSTEQQDIGYSVEKFRTVEMTDTGLGKMIRGWLQETFGKSPVQHYGAFVSKFRELVETNANLSNPYQSLVNKTRTLLKCKFENNFVEILANIFACWSLLKSNVDVTNREADNSSYLQPHPVQFLTLCKMMEKHGEQFQNQLVEIPTGEGKSLVFSVMSLIFALLNYDVHCICYSSYLSQRDYAAFEKLFDLFEVKDRIRYSTVYEMCKTLINEKGNVQQLTKSFVTSNQSGEPMPKRPAAGDRVLLIDEVDDFFGPSFQGNHYNPVTLIQDENTFQLVRTIWRDRAVITPDQVRQTPCFQNMVKAFPDWEPLFKMEVAKMIREATLYSDNSPQVFNNEIAYAMHDKLSTDVLHGYKTVFAYFYYNEKGDITDDSLKSHVGLYLGCGSFSFAEIPKSFKVIMGVSGTLEHLTNIEIETLCNYDFKRLSYAPSIYGLSRRTVEKPVIIDDKSDWILRIVQTVQDKINAGRAAIIFFSNNEVLSNFEAFVKSKDSFKAYQVLNEQTLYTDAIVKKATISGMVTLCPRIFGRGVDFVCRDNKTKSAGGVLVVQTFPSISAAESVQIRGRTARQGDPGTYELILLRGDLASINITTNELEQAKDDNRLQGLLDRKRDEVYTKSIEALIEKSKSVENKHNTTMEYHKALLDCDNSPKAKQDIRQKLLALNQNGSIVAGTKLHLYYCLDDSGSMRGAPWDELIRAVEASINKRISMYQHEGKTPNDLVTIVNYSDVAVVKCRKEKITNNPQDRTQFCIGRGTDFAAGLTATYNEMKNNEDEYLPVLLFMSDGGSSNGEKEIVQISREFKDKNVQIYVIGFGRGCNSNKMQNMANISGGKYFYGNDGEGLTSAFETISVELTTTVFRK
eukprot:TRINITY_DN108_c0_g1_i1.p1 TRINITY_DN108_c0_g1~~TRINITY_DN108_c0_g1_i1.p1  ORF type:complete len:2468 (-),score=279.40 TRINITY_DN108_c0_g1_i1:30-7379(-)